MAKKERLSTTYEPVEPGSRLYKPVVSKGARAAVETYRAAKNRQRKAETAEAYNARIAAKMAQAQATVMRTTTAPAPKVTGPAAAQKAADKKYNEWAKKVGRKLIDSATPPTASAATSAYPVIATAKPKATTAKAATPKASSVSEPTFTMPSATAKGAPKQPKYIVESSARTAKAPVTTLRFTMPKATTPKATAKGAPAQPKYIVESSSTTSKKKAKK